MLADLKGIHRLNLVSASELAVRHAHLIPAQQLHLFTQQRQQVQQVSDTGRVPNVCLVRGLAVASRWNKRHVSCTYKGLVSPAHTKTQCFFSVFTLCMCGV